MREVLNVPMACKDNGPIAPNDALAHLEPVCDCWSEPVVQGVRIHFCALGMKHHLGHAGFYYLVQALVSGCV